MKYVDPPFELGETENAVDSDSVATLTSWYGQIFEFPAQRIGSAYTPRSAKGRYTGRQIRAVILKNTSGLTLLPGHVVQLGTGEDTTASHDTQGQDAAKGYTVTLAQRCVIVDPWVISTGVPDNHIFWGIIEGRCLVNTASLNSAFNGDIAAGAPVIAATLNTTSGNSTAGGIANVTFPGQTGDTTVFNAAANLIGYALSACTTNGTNRQILVDACIRY